MRIKADDCSQYLNDVRHLLLVDASVTVDVVQTKRKFQLVCRFSALSDVDCLLKVFKSLSCV